MLTAFAFFLPFPDLGTSSHSSRTFSRTFKHNNKATWGHFKLSGLSSREMACAKQLIEYL